MWRRFAPVVALSFLAWAGPAKAAVLRVWTNSPHPGAPYDAWTNAARDIQAAVNAAAAGDTVWVTNGLYSSGSYPAPTHSLSNRVVITNAIVVRSVNGPAVTTIRGRDPGESVERRCVYITGGGMLSGFTLTNGAAHGAEWLGQLGGGALIEGSGFISNCVVCSNSALNGGGIAGYYGGELRNCFVYGNAAGAGSWFYGGGFHGFQGASAYDCVFSNNAAEVGGGVGLEVNCRLVRCVMIHNQAASGGGLSLKGGDVADSCLIVSNSASRSGGGVSFSSGNGLMLNGTVLGNTAALYPDHSGTYHVSGGTIVNSILVQNGDGSQNLDASANYQADHLCTTPVPSNGTGHVVLDPLLLADYRLRSNSPCVDAGCTDGPGDDLAGVSRPLDGNYDGVCAWDIGACEFVHPVADSDGDGMRDEAEVRAGTDATNAASLLAVQAVSSSAWAVVRWPSVAGKAYRLQRATNLVSGVFSVNVATNLAATPPLNSWTDSTATAAGPWFYRVRLE